jgi:hypothetical protein
MAKKKHPRHPKEHDLLKAIQRTPADVGGELMGAKSARPAKTTRPAKSARPAKTARPAKARRPR